MRVLVVEDEAALRAALVTALEGAGYLVQAAPDGEEGLFAATEYPCDLAIVDLGLPRLPGLELIRQLRAAGKANPRNLPCPTCKRPNQLSPADVTRGYQCDGCAAAEEGAC